MVGCAAVLVLLAWPRTPALAVETRAGVAGYLPTGDGFTLRFVHSVDRLPVEDTYQVRDGSLVLTSTRLIQFGAGMGQVSDAGVGRADGPWWRIDELDRPVGDLTVRVGSASVDHRLRHRGGELALSRCWAAQRVTLRPTSLPLVSRLLMPLLQPPCHDD